MAAPTWTIDLADDADLTARGLLGDQLYTPRPGDTINPTFRLRSAADFETLRKYVLAANQKTVLTSRRSTGFPYYREDLGAYAVSSLVVGLEPSTSNGADVWAVLIGGTDQSNGPRSVYDWELEALVLADKDDYADRTAVANEFEEPVL